MEDTDNVDIVIVGGSPAGLVSASKLVAQGFSVIIIDVQENNTYLDQLESTLVSKLAFQKMQIPYLEKGFKTQKKYAAYVHRSLELLRIHISPLTLEPTVNDSQPMIGDLLFDRSDSLVIDSKAFKKFLLHLIEKHHSRIYQCTSFSWITTSPPFSLNITTNENTSKTINCEYIIIDTVLTEKSFNEIGFISPKLFSETRFLEVEGVLADSIDVFVDFTCIPAGFLLVYPLTTSTQFVLVTACDKSSSIQFEKVTRFIKKFYLLEDKIHLQWSSPKFSYSFDKTRECYKNHILLVGDALGLTNPLTFSKMLAEIQSALVASTAIITLKKDKTLFFKDIVEKNFLMVVLKFPYTDPVHEEAAKYFYSLPSQKLLQLAKIFHYLDLSKLTTYQKYLIAIKLVQKKLYSENKQLQRLWQSYTLNRKWLL